MFFQLAPEAISQKYRVESYERVGSTNLLAAEFARSGDGGCLWVVANEQTAGKGRRGRDWISPAGNLYSSLLLVDTFAPSVAATLSFVAGVSLLEALDTIVPDEASRIYPIKLKWPNDVLAGKGKLTGILLEFLALPNGKSAIVIGIGVNVVSSPDNAPYPTSSLHGIGAKVSSQQVFQALSKSWTENYELWDRGNNLAAIREKWLSYAANLGGSVNVLVDGKTVSGTFETIDENCHFIIRQADNNRVAIPAGDVHFGSVATLRAD